MRSSPGLSTGKSYDYRKRSKVPELSKQIWNIWMILFFFFPNKHTLVILESLLDPSLVFYSGNTACTLFRLGCRLDIECDSDLKSNSKHGRGFKSIWQPLAFKSPCTLGKRICLLSLYLPQSKDTDKLKHRGQY